MDNSEEGAIAFIRQFNLAVKGLTLYPAGHPSITVNISEAHKAVQTRLARQDKLIIGLVEDLLVIDDTPLYEISESFHDLVSRLKKLDIGTITISRGVTERDIGGGLLRLLHSDAAEIKMKGGFASYLSSLDINHISVLEPREIDDKTGAEAARRVYKNAIEVVREAMEEVRLGRIPSSSGVKAVINDMVDQVLENQMAILGLSMIKSYDEYTFHHCVNVSILSLALGEAVGMPQDILNDLGVGAILHDIGKTETYESIIKKPGPLSDEEWKEVRKHPQKGADILKTMGGISETSIRVVIEHHMKYNREGYPDIEGVVSQSEPAMCVSIADCYDALTTLRPYRIPYNPGKALESMRALAGKDFEPHLFERFEEVLGIYPPGTIVRLNTNEIGIVKAPNPGDPTRPQVRLVFDRMGRKIEGEQEFLLTEADDKGWRRSIVSVVDPVVKNLDPSVYMW